MIRRTEDTRWFNEPIITLPPHTHHDRTVSLPQKFESDMSLVMQTAESRLQAEYSQRRQRWIDNGKTNKEPRKSFANYLQLAFKLRTIATFPYLAKKLRDYHLKLTWLERIQNSWLSDNTNPYVKHLDKIIESSSKLVSLKGVLDEMTTDYQGRPEKLLIMSYSPVVCYLVKLVCNKSIRFLFRPLMIKQWIQRERPESMATFVHSGMTPEERNDIVQAFQEERGENGALPRNPSPDYLIGSTRLLGTGHTCTRALRMVLMEPDWIKATKQQAIKRISRIGQLNTGGTFSYRLLCSGMPVEETIIKKQELRLKFKDHRSYICLHHSRGVVIFDVSTQLT